MTTHYLYKNNNENKDVDVVFIKRVLIHPRERLVRETKQQKEK